MDTEDGRAAEDMPQPALPLDIVGSAKGWNEVKHDWRLTSYKPGYKRKTCVVCGATKDCFNIYMRNTDRWMPAILDSKRQPFCPGKREEATHDKP